MAHSVETPLRANLAIISLTAVLLFGTGWLLGIEKLRDEALVVLSSALLVGFTALYLVRHELRPLLQARLLYSSARLYFSFAYLYRIRTSDGDYVLVRHKENEQFQPVGGVYKCHRSKEFEEFLSRIGARLLPPTAPHRVNDLRGHVPGRNLHALLRWFKSGEQRENTPLREFYEEMVASGLLDASTFRYIDYRHAGTIWSPVFKMDDDGYAVMVHDVYDLLLTQEQGQALEELRNQQPPDKRVCFAQADEIMRLGHTDTPPVRRNNIARHTRNTLVLRWT